MNRYGPKAANTIKKTLKRYKAKKLKIGQSDKLVKNRQQAIAIGISEAREKGYKVPQKEGR